jgi:beta-lactamase class A
MNAGDPFVAASTYKLAVLMDEAERIASGRVSASGTICFQEQDLEDGPYGDYTEGSCWARSTLMERAGKASDNTAARMLVRDLGGAAAVNDYARSRGATSSRLIEPNTTTAGDLASLLAVEAGGKAGGRAAQDTLFPYLTGTENEAGVPAGVPAGVRVVHKDGWLDDTENDAALVLGGPRGSYVLVVLTDGVGGQEGWSLVAGISARVWSFENSAL